MRNGTEKRMKQQTSFWIGKVREIGKREGKAIRKVRFGVRRREGEAVGKVKGVRRRINSWFGTTIH